MDTMRGFERDDDSDRYLNDQEDEGVESPPIVGTDERRMHVRAYNYWVSLLHGRAYPAIEDLDPASIDDFGPHSVLLDFTADVENPRIAWVGASLREECALPHGVDSIADVPARSLLSRLTSHYLQIIANRAPIGFEAEFTSHRGLNTMYRGILMPFSSNDDTIDFIYGVINWKELVAPDLAAELVLEVDQAIRAARPPSPAPIWADGPNAGPLDDEDDDSLEIDEPLPADATLADRLAVARATAEAAALSDGRSRTSLYAALGRAYDFAIGAEADAQDYAEMLEDAGLKAQDRAPMTPIVKLVFGVDYDKTRLTEYAAALSFGRRTGVEAGAMGAFLEGFDGGLKGVVKAERRERAPVRSPDRGEAARARARMLPTRAVIAMEAGDAEFVLLLARRTNSGELAVLASVGDEAMVERAIRKA